MSDEGWEARMAAQAAAREAARPPEPDPDPYPEHAGHHTHLIGVGVECSCGFFFGVTTVAFDDDYDPDKLFCSECGKQGAVKFPHG
jgi:hypothetical protein